MGAGFYCDNQDNDDNDGYKAMDNDDEGKEAYMAFVPGRAAQKGGALREEAHFATRHFGLDTLHDPGSDKHGA
jgi:hypothetical protein